MLFPQPESPEIHEERHPVDGACSHCGAASLATYRAADYQGWLRVVKCQECLTTADRTRILAPAQGG